MSDISLAALYVVSIHFSHRSSTYFSPPRQRALINLKHHLYAFSPALERDIFNVTILFRPCVLVRSHLLTIPSSDRISALHELVPDVHVLSSLLEITP
jgi:hypothetical protein